MPCAEEAWVGLHCADRALWMHPFPRNADMVQRVTHCKVAPKAPWGGRVSNASRHWARKVSCGRVSGRHVGPARPVLQQLLREFQYHRNPVLGREVALERRRGQLHVALSASHFAAFPHLTSFQSSARAPYEALGILVLMRPGTKVVAFVFVVLVRSPTRSNRLTRRSSAS